MGMRELESAILAEAKIVTSKSKLRIKDIMEWSTGKIKPQVDEVRFFLPVLKVYILIKEDC